MLLDPPRHLGRNYPMRHRAVFAQMLAKCNVSARQCGNVVDIITHGFDARETSNVSKDTANRCLVEGAMCLDHEMAKKLSQTRELYVGIDETSKIDRRSFIELEFGGILEGKMWGYIFSLTEVAQHKAKDLVSLIKSTLSKIRKLQKALDCRETQLWDLEYIVFDWTSVNTGRYNGLFKKLKQKRKREWRKKTGGIGPLKKFSMKGCEDHLVALIAKEWDSKVGVLAKHWEDSQLMTSKPRSSVKNGVTELISELTKRLRGLWKAPFAGYCQSRYTRRKRKPRSFTRVSNTRYVSYEIAASELYDCFKPIVDFVLKEAKDDLELLKTKATFMKLQSNLVCQVIKMMKMINTKFSRCVMKKAAELDTVAEYEQLRAANNQFFSSMLTSAAMRAKFFEMDWLKEVTNVDPTSVNLNDREKVHCIALAWITAGQKMYNKHADTFKGHTLQSLKATNRSGERIFAQVNLRLEANRNTRVALLESYVKVSSAISQGISVDRCFAKYWKKHGIVKKARSYLASSTSRKSLNQQHYIHWKQTTATRAQQRGRRQAKLAKEQAMRSLMARARSNRHRISSITRFTIKSMKEGLRQLKRDHPTLHIPHIKSNIRRAEIELIFVTQLTAVEAREGYTTS